MASGAFDAADDEDWSAQQELALTLLLDGVAALVDRFGEPGKA